MGIPTGILSTYTFDHTNLWGNFSYSTVFGFFTFEPATSANIATVSVLTQVRPSNEFLINLYSAFNTSAFLALVDVTPEIDGRSVDNNANALMYTIARPMNHYGYRSSDIRAGWIEWRDVPYHAQAPGAHQDSDLLNQVAFNFHIDRGVGTVDNDGWVTFYYKFLLDGPGRLGAYVDGWAYQFGGGTGLNDGGEDLGAALRKALPAFVSTLQSFLNTLCSNAAVFTPSPRDSNGRPLFELFYLLPGNGNRDHGAPNVLTGVPAPGHGAGDKPVDTEVTLALIPKVTDTPPSTPSIPRSYVADLAHSLKGQGWHLQTRTADPDQRLTATRESDGRAFELSLSLTEIAQPVAGSGVVRQPPNQKDEHR